ncbi:UNVERIFIED_CONTAM: hypothetical protein GTU68_049798 [Idotea baltica]|nr:hypothetical protein [Idotea baltica]
MSALTSVLVTLYEEPNKPKDALNFVIDSLNYRSNDAKSLEYWTKR